MSAPQEKVPPLALALLAAFVVGIPLALFGPSILRQFEGPPEPLWQALDVGPITPVQGDPTIGMTLSSRGFGTVDVAPTVVATMTESPPVSLPDTRPAPDVAGFVAAWAVLERNRGVPDRIATCNLVGIAPTFGRITLRDGCLKVAFGDAPEQPLLPRRALLFRDDEGYLALGVPGETDDRSVRVGEADASILVASCPVPREVAPPPSYARACGPEAMVVAAQIGRRPLCSAQFLAERARMEHEEAATAKRVAAEAEACRIRGEEVCPPGVIPRLPPLTDRFSGCRLPAGYRSSQGSSTQP